ncbi:putative ornithine cyclodeaminase mu-crystallin-like [Gaiella occulta]|uniref:Putative ornithine cyclodeaminase mu-crystallin-like n=1 Tax=Gaiella occulta TaxID=1002870 RepID=A0A7M2YW12_9ACTN|nr:ornithine cyclodeaminase family protein [Gaiella occulta]RDI73920.1 putative ornithine cyclodeaminase mu-crystallin-like [Gaiella occulta]
MAADSILYLSGREVARALETIDIVEAVAAALAAHARGQSVLPAEAYLAWSHAGETLRSLSMPGMVDGRAGVKIINANPANPGRGLPRASGLTLLFDNETGRPLCIMEAARISCLRTAAVTALAADLLGAAPIERLAILGAGALARCHLELLPNRLPDLREIRLHDLDRARAAALAAAAATALVCDSAEQAIRGAQLVVPLTTATSGYIHYDWLDPGALLVNVSLDDPLPEVVLRAGKLFVDDWPLVAADERRLLGRPHRAGQIRGPDARDAATATGSRLIDGELGELLIGTRQGRSRPDEVIVVNPFGLAIEDVAVADRVYREARRLGLGTALDR